MSFGSAVPVILTDFNNVTTERHVKAKVKSPIRPGQRVVVVDPVEQESLDGTVIGGSDGHVIVDVGGGSVMPRPLALLTAGPSTGSPAWSRNRLHPTTNGTVRILVAT